MSFKVNICDPEWQSCILFVPITYSPTATMINTKASK